MPAAREAKHTKALEFFKDWSNYLLATTTAAVGWVAQFGTATAPCIKIASIVALTLAVVFGIFTLALIPLVQEQRKKNQSIYAVKAEFYLLGLKCRHRLKFFCWPQHVFFMLGISLYALGAIWPLWTALK